jgi:hypothetical protein
LTNSSPHGRHGTGRTLEVCVWNPLRDEDSVFEHEAIIADFRDDSGTHLSAGQFAVNVAVFDGTKLLNRLSIADFFRGQE